MSPTARRTLIFILILFAACSVQDSFAQSGFRLKRTKKESIPINVKLLAGYNAMSNPADIIQDYYLHSTLTSLGGVAFGLQGMIELDTLLTQIWVGAEVEYYRMAKRWLFDDHGVHYSGETYEANPVDAVSRLYGLGANLLVGIGPFARFTLIGGPGVQYQFAQVDKDLPIEGHLYGEQIVPTALGGISVQLLVYDHGSIDASFRGLWGFGEYGSFQFISMLGVTFNF